MHFEDNVIWQPAGLPGSDSFPISAAFNGDPLFRHNTFVACGAYIAISEPGAPLTFEGNIVYNGDVHLGGPPGGCVCCNDVWGGTLDVMFPWMTSERNISADPRFCGPEEGDFHIARNGPCYGDSLPPDCDRMGALEAACDVLPVLITTWGRIKARYAH